MFCTILSRERDGSTKPVEIASTLKDKFGRDIYLLRDICAFWNKLRDIGQTGTNGRHTHIRKHRQLRLEKQIWHCTTWAFLTKCTVRHAFKSIGTMDGWHSKKWKGVEGGLFEGFWTTAGHQMNSFIQIESLNANRYYPFAGLIIIIIIVIVIIYIIMIVVQLIGGLATGRYNQSSSDHDK